MIHKIVHFYILHIFYGVLHGNDVLGAMRVHPRHAPVLSEAGRKLNERERGVKNTVAREQEGRGAVSGGYNIIIVNHHHHHHHHNYL